VPINTEERIFNVKTSFVHLRLHSEYSLVDGMVRIKPLVQQVVKLGMPAIALTDVTNFYGLVKFYQAAQAVGVKPICGADLQMSSPVPDGLPASLTLLVMNQQVYRNLTKLISRAFQEGQHRGVPYVERQWVSEASEGLIVLSGRLGDVGQAILSGKSDYAKELLQGWLADFPDRFYLELTRTGRPDEENFIHELLPIATTYQCPVVATNDVRFLESEQFEAHEARVCIGEGRVLGDPRRERRYSDQQYLRSPEEMAELFSDLPEALENSVEIAKRCTLDLKLGEHFLPDYPIPEGMTKDSFFEKASFDGLDKRLGRLLDPSAPDYQAQRQVYLDRLRFELDIIIQMGFPGYFLIVMDFIRWAKDNDIPVGPGRGSGAGSLVAYALGITDLDPLEYDLLFERFLNPERVSMPDFDIDFCMDNRDRVIAYVADRYGRDAVSQIITFGTMAAKAVVRDVARVQGKAYGLADKLSKMIPPDIGMTLEKAVAQEEVLREFLESDEEAQEIWEMALQLEGVTRNVGKHAGGVVIAPTTLTDFAPLYCDENGEGLVTQFDKDDVEKAGLVKFDFLGLRTLTIIDGAIKMVNQRLAKVGEPPIAIEAIPLDDAATYGLMRRAETTAVFQLESRGMKDLIKRVEPNCFEDVVALVALFRPGPLQSGMVDDFINRKHGRAQVAYPDAKFQHESLKPVLGPTYGVIVYQEQVMQIAQVLAGYTLGGADMLRRAMGKKKPEEMAKQRSIFEEGARQQGIDPELAVRIFDLVEKFAGYGFNKSHSAAYALLAYQTAWLKAHYPAEFMAAVLSADMQNTDKVVTLIDECRAMDLVVLPPDVNRGRFAFTVSDDNEVIYGLGAIKGLGEGPVNSIIAAREEGGSFSDLFDFCARVDGHKLNKRALEALIRCGALDAIGPTGEIGYRRAVMLAASEEAVKMAEQNSRNTDSGMTDLFGDTPRESAPEIGYQSFQQQRGLSAKERLRSEKETLGLYLTGHPVDEYLEELKHFVQSRIADLKPDKKSQLVAGLVVGMRVIKTRRGDNMAVITLDDRSGRIEVAIFADAYKAHRDKIEKDALLVVEGQVAEDDYTGGLKMRADHVRNLFEARVNYLKAISLDINQEKLGSTCLDQLADIMLPFRDGSCPVRINYQSSTASGEIMLGEHWAVSPEDDLLHKLRELLGNNGIHLRF